MIMQAKLKNAEQTCSSASARRHGGAKVSRLLVALKECSRSRDLEKGKQVHAQALAGATLSSKYVITSLITMYASCGSMRNARKVFDEYSLPQEPVPLTALLKGYVDNGDSHLALEILEAVELQYGRVSDARLFVVALSAFATLASSNQTHDQPRLLEKGKAVHSRALASGCYDTFVANALINLYGKCQSMELAREVFNSIPQRDVVSWNSLILGYVENGESVVALTMVQTMDVDGFTLNSRTFAAAVKACGQLQAIDLGVLFHGEIRSKGLHRDVLVSNCLLDFYCKCGRMEDAKRVFDATEKKTTVTWTSLMCGYGLQGDSNQVLELFNRMKEQGVEPDEATFVCVLAACSHAGLTSRGRECFESMEREYGMKPNSKHCACMVDLLGRAKDIEEVMDFVKNSPVEVDAVTWKSVLAACEDGAAGKAAYESLMKVSWKDAASYNLISNILHRNALL